MMTGPHAPDDRRGSNGRRLPARARGFAGDDPLEARRARLVAFWALVLRRFREEARRNGDLAGRAERHREEDR
jgi:hypothetical protein